MRVLRKPPGDERQGPGLERGLDVAGEREVQPEARHARAGPGGERRPRAAAEEAARGGPRNPGPDVDERGTDPDLDHVVEAEPVPIDLIRPTLGGARALDEPFRAAPGGRVYPEVLEPLGLGRLQQRLGELELLVSEIAVPPQILELVLLLASVVHPPGAAEAEPAETLGVDPAPCGVEVGGRRIALVARQQQRRDLVLGLRDGAHVAFAVRIGLRFGGRCALERGDEALEVGRAFLGRIEARVRARRGALDAFAHDSAGARRVGIHGGQIVHVRPVEQCPMQIVRVAAYGLHAGKHQSNRSRSRGVVDVDLARRTGVQQGAGEVFRDRQVGRLDRGDQLVPAHRALQIETRAQHDQVGEPGGERMTLGTGEGHFGLPAFDLDERLVVEIVVLRMQGLAHLGRDA